MDEEGKLEWNTSQMTMTHSKNEDLISGHLCEDSEKVYCINKLCLKNKKVKKKSKPDIGDRKKEKLLFVDLGLIYMRYFKTEISQTENKCILHCHAIDTPTRVFSSSFI